MKMPNIYCCLQKTNTIECAKRFKHTWISIITWMVNNKINLNNNNM